MRGIYQDNMEGCFSKIDTRQLQGMLSCCGEILYELEKSVHPEKPIGNETHNPKIYSI